MQVIIVIIMASVRELETLLDSTASPNTLLRPKFWRMGVRRFTEGFSNQFIGRGTANEVYSIQISSCLYKLLSKGFSVVSDNKSLCTVVVSGVSGHLDREQGSGGGCYEAVSNGRDPPPQLCRGRVRSVIQPITRLHRYRYQLNQSQSRSQGHVI